MTHLIHIGFPKTGSTYLQRWFAEHPEIRFARGGIAGFQTVYDIVRRAARRQGAGPCVTSAEGLATPLPRLPRSGINYRALDDFLPHKGQTTACELLSDLFPSAKILIVTRGFRSMILSSYSQYLRTGGDGPFDLFCVPSTVHMIDALDYDHVIRAYERTFGKERVIVLPYELLRDDADRFLSLIAGQVGVGPFRIARVRDNRSISRESLAWYPYFAAMLSRFPLDGFVRRLYRRAANRDWLAPLARLMQRLRPRPVPTVADIPSDILRELAKRSDLLRDRDIYQPYLDEYLLPDLWQAPLATADADGAMAAGQ